MELIHACPEPDLVALADWPAAGDPSRAAQATLF